MMTNLESDWFTEIEPVNGSAFSLQIKAKLHEEQTPYQRIAIYETVHFGKLMTIDGCTMVSDRDNFIYHEMMSHPALFTHPQPRRVVIIGGGDCGVLREVLKHSTVEQVLQVDIDERVTRLAERYFPDLCESNHDVRAELRFADGIRWMASAPDESVDVIIIDSTDPIGPAEGLFNREFYRHCRRVLATSGILIQQSSSPLFHIELMKSMHQALRAEGFTSTRSLLFPQGIYPSGWWSAIIAGHGDLTQFRTADAQNKNFKTRFYYAEMHSASLVLPTFLAEALTF